MGLMTDEYLLFLSSRKGEFCLHRPEVFAEHCAKIATLDHLVYSATRYTRLSRREVGALLYAVFYTKKGAEDAEYRAYPSCV